MTKTHDEKLNLVDHLTHLLEVAADKLLFQTQLSIDIELHAYTRQLVTYLSLFVYTFIQASCVIKCPPESWISA